MLFTMATLILHIQERGLEEKDQVSTSMTKLKNKKEGRLRVNLLEKGFLKKINHKTLHKRMVIALATQIC